MLLLLDDHLGTDEIAQRLFISEHTVRSHVKSLLRKLGVSSRREALERLAFARAARTAQLTHVGDAIPPKRGHEPAARAISATGRPCGGFRNMRSERPRKLSTFYDSKPSSAAWTSPGSVSRS